MANLVPFQPRHLALLTLRDGDSDLSFVQLVRKARSLRSNGPSYTLLTDRGEVAACGGVVFLWRGVAEAWAVSSTLVHQYAKTFHRTCKITIEDCIRIKKLHRVQAVVSRDHKFSHRWVRALGFEPESLLRGYGADGSDYVMYARIIQCQS